MDELRLVGRLRAGVPESSDLSNAQARFMVGIEGAATGRPSRGPRRRAAWLPAWRLLTVSALTCALAVGVTVAGNIELGTRPSRTGGAETPAGGGETGGETPVILRPIANVEDLATRASRKAASEPQPTPRPDQWTYDTSLLATSSEAEGKAGRLLGRRDQRITVEHWRRVDGSKRAWATRGGAIKLKTLSEMERTGLPRTDYGYLLSLPTDPKALLAKVRQDASDQSDLGSGAFATISLMMSRSVLPPKVRAALYGALALIPHVRLTPHAWDLAGRKGVSLVLTDGYERNEIMVDPVTFAYLGFRVVSLRDRTERTEHGVAQTVPRGTVLGWGSQLKAVIVDRPGQRR